VINKNHHEFKYKVSADMEQAMLSLWRPGARLLRPVWKATWVGWEEEEMRERGERMGE
jgi:hypothetical protein